MLNYPNIDPVILHITDKFAIRWYSLAYVFGFLFSIWFFKKQNKKLKIMLDKYCDTFLTYTLIGLIVGARVFDCFFYNLSYTIHNPLSIFELWNGGMSFHGGAIGLFISVYLFGKKYKIKSFRVLDVCVVVIPLSLGFGRIANFINGELYGNITYTSPLRMVFPGDPLQQPRHPSQLYEAFTEGFLLFCIMYTLFKKTNMIKYTGLSCCCFGIFYSLFRFICEFFRKPEISNIFWFTAGQIISIFLFLICLVCAIFILKKNK